MSGSGILSRRLERANTLPKRCLPMSVARCSKPRCGCMNNSARRLMPNECAPELGLTPADSDDLHGLCDPFQAHLARLGDRKLAGLSGLPARQDLATRCHRSNTRRLVHSLAPVIQTNT